MKILILLALIGILVFVIFRRNRSLRYQKILFYLSCLDDPCGCPQALLYYSRIQNWTLFYGISPAAYGYLDLCHVQRRAVESLELFLKRFGEGQVELHRKVQELAADMESNPDTASKSNWFAHLSVYDTNAKLLEKLTAELNILKQEGRVTPLSVSDSLVQYEGKVGVPKTQ